MFSCAFLGSRPLAVQSYMFEHAMEHQTSKEQRDKWLRLTKEYTIIGGYAQTEMGHGINIYM